MTAAADGPPWRVQGGCVIVRVRLTPKSSKDIIDGLEATAEGPALKARVRAVPEDGKANAAVARLVAEWLDLPKSAVEVTAGLKSRVKSLSIAGDAKVITELLERRLAKPA